MPHQKSSDYKETAVQYYLVEDKTQEEIIYELSYKMGVLNEKRCKNVHFLFYENTFPRTFSEKVDFPTFVDIAPCMQCSSIILKISLP